LLKADLLEWTGGFSPEREKDIEVYVRASLPFQLDDAEAAGVLRA
jgi:hypothetical protein